MFSFKNEWTFLEGQTETRCLSQKVIMLESSGASSFKDDSLEVGAFQSYLKDRYLTISMLFTFMQGKPVINCFHPLTQVK